MTGTALASDVASADLAPFRRIVVAVDETVESQEAARQAAVLRAPGGDLHLLATVNAAAAAHAGFAAPGLVDQMLLGARAALDRAVAATGPTTERLARGRPTSRLLDAVRRHDATLVVVGCREHRRAAGLLVGDVGSVVLREAPCSVLVARPDTWPDGRPERIVVGIDGSPESDRAARVGASVASRFGARLTLVVGLGGKLRDPRAVVERNPGAVVDQRPPVDALVAASRSADLLVVGSRGLHGLHALGSVSERVAHRAHASVLVVRG